MIKSFLRLSLGVFLIVAASAVLLLTDKGSQHAGLGSSDSNPAGPQRVFSVALFQHVSQPIIEEGAKGVIAGLAAAGYQDGDTIRLRRFNAEGDAATSNTIARELVGGEYDLIVTLSTPSLQAVAGANRDAKVPHVFGMVSDPVAAGVGIARDDPKKHPPYMVGLGTMQPVAEAFRMARKLAPKLARVGVAWNPSEANSEACTKIARTVCRELGIELLEANVDNSAGVREAVASVIGRGAEAIWIGGDVTVLASIESVIGPARSAGIPVFSNIPGCGARGTLFDLGADYYQVGGKVGELAGRVLGGRAAGVVAHPLRGSRRVLDQPGRARADQGRMVVPQGDRGQGRRAGRAERPRPPPSARGIRQGGTETRPAPRGCGRSDWSRTPMRRSWRRHTAVCARGSRRQASSEGRDFKINYRNAQGDIATLNSICDEMNGNDDDLVISFTTTALQAALRKIDRKPLLFALVLDPFAAGAGKSDTDHRANVTGVYLAFPYAEVARCDPRSLAQGASESAPSSRPAS